MINMNCPADTLNSHITKLLSLKGIQGLGLKLNISIVFTWQGFGSRDSCRDGHCGKAPGEVSMADGVSSRQIQKRTHLWTKLSPSDTSVITYLRSGEKCCRAAMKEVRKNVRETTLQIQMSVKKKGENVLQDLEQIPLQPTEKMMVTQVVPLKPVEDHVGADIHTAACGEKPTLQKAPGRTFDPVGDRH